MKALRAGAKPLRKTPKNPTWEYPAGSGIKISELQNRTAGAAFGVSYQVRLPAKLLGRLNKREIHQRKTREEAERLAEDRLATLRQYGTSFVDLPPDAQQQAVVAWGMLKPHGIGFVDAAEAAIQALRPAGGQRSVEDVIQELLGSKTERLKAGRLDQRTHEDFKSRSKKIGAALGKRSVSTLAADDVTAWLRSLSQTLSFRSVLNYRNTLAEILRYAKARRYVSANPMEGLAREELKTLGGERPERRVDEINVLTVDEARRLLNAAAAQPKPNLLPSLVLRLFCGLRTTESVRLVWPEVHWVDAQPFVHIPAGKAKKRRIRHVEIPPNAVAWLRFYDPPTSGPVAPGNGKTKGYCKRFARLARLAEIGTTEGGRWSSHWETNDTRHSFGSYHYALHGDSVRTSALMGHKQGDDVLFAHYRALVQKADAEAYFNLYPENAPTRTET